MRISDWSSDVCSSDLVRRQTDQFLLRPEREVADVASRQSPDRIETREGEPFGVDVQLHLVPARDDRGDDVADNRRTVDERRHRVDERSEEHTSELQSLMRISYAVFCLKKKKYWTRRNSS